ncbi:CND2 protein, partial [Turnix velox]|nr:CND2 protein [Turnix velox]
FGEGDIGFMCLQLSTNPGEYSYFSPRTLSRCAGPEHWRFRPRHKTEANSNGENKKRKPKKAFQIDFDEDVDFAAHFRKTKACITLAKSILESENTKSTTLPLDFNYDPKTILQLFLKPVVKVRDFSKSLPKSTLDHEDEIAEYDYNNPNDTSNFCPSLQAADSDEDYESGQCKSQMEGFNLTTQPEDPELNLFVGDTNITAYGEQNLIPEPQKINKIVVQYAKSAKKMDMKRLKKSMWNLLTDQEE